MDFLALFKMLLSGHSIKDWIVSVNGAHKGPVTEGKVGLKGTTFWAHMKFQVDGVDHHIEGERPLQGGLATVSLDGVVVPDAHLALKKHVVGFPPRVRVEINFDLHGVHYRFDGNIV